MHSHTSNVFINANNRLLFFSLFYVFAFSRTFTFTFTLLTRNSPQTTCVQTNTSFRPLPSYSPLKRRLSYSPLQTLVPYAIFSVIDLFIRMSVLINSATHVLCSIHYPTFPIRTTPPVSSLSYCYLPISLILLSHETPQPAPRYIHQHLILSD